MSATTTHIHNVVNIKVRVVDFGDFVNNELTFTTSDDSTITVCAFAKHILNIEAPKVIERAAKDPASEFEWG